MGNKNKALQRKFAWILIVALIFQILPPVSGQPVKAEPEGVNGTPATRNLPTPQDYGVFQNVTHTLTLDPGHEQLCMRNLTGEIIFDWPEPSEFVDLVIVQDMSANFTNTISQVGDTISQIVDSLNMGTDIDGTSPKDRVMIQFFGGNLEHTMTVKENGDWTRKLYVLPYTYNVWGSSLSANKDTIQSYISNNYIPSYTAGDSPAIDGMVVAKDQYEAWTDTTNPFDRDHYQVNGQDRYRKTVYLLISAGVPTTAQWRYIPSAGQAEFGLTSPPLLDYRPYVWLAEKKLTRFDTAHNTVRNYYEAYGPMLTGMKQLAAEWRTSGGLRTGVGATTAPATVVTAFWENLNILTSTYGNNWNNTIRGKITGALQEMTGYNPDYFVTSQNINNFQEALIQAFEKSSSPIIDKVQIGTITGTSLNSFTLYKKNSFDEYEVVPPREGNQSSVASHSITVDMQYMQSGTYKIVYTLSEDQFRAEDYQPIQLSMTFEETTEIIGTPEDGNIPTVPGNPKTDCSFIVSKYATSGKADYSAANVYKELQQRRQDFYYSSTFNLTPGGIQLANDSVVFTDTIDDRLLILDAYLVAANDAAGVDAVSGATLNNTLIAALNPSNYPDAVPAVRQLALNGNTISYSLPENPGEISGETFKFGGHAGKDYVLVVKVRIKDEVSDDAIQQMRTIDEDGLFVGIPNVAKVLIDGGVAGGGTEVLSPRARAVPPALARPEVSTSVKSQNGVWYPLYNTLGAQNEPFSYRIEFNMPFDTTGYQKLVISDVLDETIEPVNLDENLSVYYYEKDGLEPIYLSDQQRSVVYDGGTRALTVTIEEVTLAEHMFELMAEGKLRVEFDVKIKANANLAALYDKGSGTIAIPNVAGYKLNSDETFHYSNQVKTYVPLSKVDLTKLENSTDVPLNGAQFTLVDTTDTTVENRVFASDELGLLSVDMLVPGHTYTLTETKAPYGYKLNGANSWMISVANNGVVTITSGPDGSVSGSAITAYNEKPTSPPITKWLRGENDSTFVQPTWDQPYVLDRNDRLIIYQARVGPFGDMNGYSKIQIRDQVDPFLLLVSQTHDYKFFLDGNESDSVEGTMSLDLANRTAVFTKTEGLEQLANRTLYVQVQIRADVAKLDALFNRPDREGVPYDGRIPNTAQFILNDQEPVSSNEVVVQLTRGKVNLAKTISDEDGNYPVSLPTGLSAGFALYRVVGEPDPTSAETDDVKISDHTLNGGGGMLEVANLAPGTYYFLETAAPVGYVKQTGMIPVGTFEIPADGGDLSSNAVTVTADNQKAPEPTVAKLVKGINREEFSAETYKIGIGEIWQYAIDLTIPATAQQKEYTLSDTICEFFDVRGVRVYSKPIDGEWGSVEDTTAKSFLVLSSSIGMVLPADEVVNYQGKVIRIEIDVRVLPGTNLLANNAILSDGTIPNTVYLSYDGGSDSSTVSIKPTILREVAFLKKLGSEPLPNTRFQLFHDLVDANGDGVPDNPVMETFTNPPVPYDTYSSYPDGKVSFNNVPAGEYWLVETPLSGKIPVFRNIKVVVREVVAEGSPSVEFKTANGVLIDDNRDGSIVIFNNELVTIPVVMTWVDDNNLYYKRPESVQLTLKRKVGETIDATFSKTVTLPENELWTHTFSGNDLLRFDPANREYTYYLEEEPILYYDTSYDGFNITNTLGEVDFRVIKRNGDTGLPIIGTTFTLQDPMGNRQLVASAAPYGVIEFKGLKKGVNYVLSELQNDFSAPYIYNTGTVGVFVDNEGKIRLTPAKFELIDPDNDPGTDNSGYLFLNYLEPEPIKKIKVGDELLDLYNITSLREEVTYQIKVPVKGTGDINSLKISDTLAFGMTLVGDPVIYMLDGDSQVSYLPQDFFSILKENGRGITLTADRASGKNIDLLANKDLIIELKARIVLYPSVFANQYPSKLVPNQAVLDMNNRVENRLETNTVNLRAELTDLTFTKKLAVYGGEPAALPPGVTARFELGMQGVTATRPMTVGSEPFVITNLDVGKYILTEIDAPEGYLPVPPIYFEVKRNGETFEIYRYSTLNDLENSQNGSLMADRILGDVVDPHPVLPVLNKMVKPVGSGITTGTVDDYKHYDMTTWKEEVDFVVDITVPSDIRAYETLRFRDVLPVGLDLVDFDPSVEVGSLDAVNNAVFAPDVDQTPYSALTVGVSQTPDTKQYMVTMDAENALLRSLAGKTVRIVFTAAISDKFTVFSELILNDDNFFENTANVKVNSSISINNSATVKPVPQYGLVLKKIADYQLNGSDVPLSGAVFTLSRYVKASEYGPALPEGMAMHYITGENGILEIPSRLEPGKYILTETTTPAGYGALYTTLLLEVGVDIGEGVMGVRVTAVDANLDPLEPTVILYENQDAPTADHPVVITNRERINVTATKVWVDDNNARHTRPETITLTLKRAVVEGEADTIAPDGQLVPDNGNADVPDQNFAMEIALPAGQTIYIFEGDELYRRTTDGKLYNYYVVETVPSGYAASYSAEGTAITNTLIKTQNFTLLKQDDTVPPNVLEGAKFNVSFTDGLGRTIVETKTTSAQGEIDLSGLLANTVYTLREIEAPAGFQADTTVYTVVVDAHGVPTVYTEYYGAGSASNVQAANFSTSTNPDAYLLTVTDAKLNPPTPEKKIEGLDSYNLPSLSSEFEYTVDVPVESVEGMTSFKIEDTVHDLLMIVPDSGTVRADGMLISTPQNLTVAGKTITFTLTNSFAAIANRTVKLSFKAKVATGVTLDDLHDFVSSGNNAGIPNEAAVTFNDKTAASGKVYLVPGDAGPAPTVGKTVNGRDHHNLRTNDDIFRYKVSVAVPENVLGYNSLAVVDTLAKVLTVDGDVRLTLLSPDGSTRPLLLNTEYTLTNTVDPGSVAGDGIITAAFVNNYDYTVLAGKTIVMEFDAKIKQGVTQEQLDAYADTNTGQIIIPNEAHVAWNGQDNAPEDATVTPTGEPTVDKKVNHEEHVTLNGNQLSAPIAYTIDVTVPFNTSGMKKFVIRDEINNVLTISGTAVSIEGINNDDVGNYVTLANNNNVVTATIDGNEKIAALAGKTITLLITTSVDQTKDLADYLAEGVLPNTAEVVIDDKSPVSDAANITPALGEVSINKTLEGLETWPAGEKAVFKLEKRIETIPTATWVFVKNVEITGFATVLIDSLLPDTYRLTETSAPAGFMTADPWEFTVTGAGESISHTFENSKLPSIEKAVDKAFFVTVADERTFTIRVPVHSVEGLNNLVVTDLVDEFFTIVPNSAQAFLDSAEGTALSVQPVVSGQKITLTLSGDFDFSEIGNHIIILTYRVKLKNGFSYNQLPVSYKANGIPNTAGLVINNNPAVVTTPVSVKVPVGSVTLTKLAAGGQLPPGTSATFELYRGTHPMGTCIGTYSTSKTAGGDDIIYVAGLIPGDYYFIETVPPAGDYVLNEAPRVFSIVVHQETGAASSENIQVNNIMSYLPVPQKWVGSFGDEVNKSHLRLSEFNAWHSYKVQVIIPAADTINDWVEFTLVDSVDSALVVDTDSLNVFDGTFNYKITDIDPKLTFNAGQNTINFTVTGASDVAGFADKTIILTFDARIKDSYTVDQFLSDHPNSLITNKARLSVDNGDPQGDLLESDSNSVTVAPPLPMPKPVVFVHGDHQGNVPYPGKPDKTFRLGTLDQCFTYEIRLNIPPNSGNNTKVTLKNWMNELVEPVHRSAEADPITGYYTTDSVKIYVGDVYLPPNGEIPSLNDFVYYDAANNAIIFEVENTDPSNPLFDFHLLEEKELRMEIHAKFKDGVTKEELNNYVVVDQSSPLSGSVVIPNSAGLLIGENEADWLYSNTVNVTPPGDEPTVEKTVENTTGTNSDEKDALLLKNKGDAFTYKVKVDIPANVSGYENITIEDTLKNVLLVNELTEIDVLVGSTSNQTLKEKVQITGNKISLSITEGFTQYAGKSITLVINTKIKEGVTLDQIAHAFGHSAIPNEATLTFNGVPKNSNVVTVTPPGGMPTPVKSVNAQTDIVLGNITDTFVYNVSYTIPTNVSGFNSLIMNDALEEVLTTTLGDVQVYVDEVANSALKGLVDLAVDTQTGAQTITLAMEAPFDFAPYAGKTIRVEIKAKIKANADLSGYADRKIPNEATLQLNDHEAVTSNEVTVKPPKGRVILAKVVDGEPLSGNQEATFKLYKVSGEMDELPGTANQGGDTADVLIQINGADEANVNAANNKITVSELDPGDYYFIETAAPEGYMLNSAPIAFTVSPEQSIPVSLTWNNVSNLMPVKTVNHSKMIEVKDFSQAFTYRVSVPVGSVSAITQFVIRDEVNALLSIVPDTVKVYKQDGTVLADKDLNATEIAVDGNEITFTRTADFASMANSLVTLEFKATLKAGVTVQELVDASALSVGIPNTATLKINAQQPVASDTVHVKPVLGDVTLTKTGDGLPLGGGLTATFSLYKVTGEMDETPGTANQGGDTPDVKIGDDRTTVNGKITVTNLISGQYYFVETVAPAGYKLDATPVEFTVYGGEKDGVNPVAVTADNESADVPIPEKTINETKSLTLDSLTQEFTYKVSVPVVDVNGVMNFVIRDEVNAFLAIVPDSAGAKIGLDNVAGSVVINGQTVTYTATPADIAAMAGKTVTLTFKATVKTGTTYEALVAQYPNLEIPNKATLQINGNALVDSDTVTVTPVFGRVVLAKTSEGAALSEGLSAVFSLYRKTAQGDEFIKDYQTVHGKIEVLNLSPGNYCFKEKFAPAGHILDDETEHTFTINGDATTTPVADGNDVHITVDNKTPKDGPTVSKLVEGSNHHNLTALDDVIAYTVSMAIPAQVDGYESLVLEDKIDQLFTITHADVSVVGTYELLGTDGTLTIDEGSNLVTYVFDEDFDYTNIAGQTVVLTVTVKLAAGVTPAMVTAAYPDNKIPNTAKQIFNGTATNSNSVTVTPPGDGPSSIAKDVEGKTNLNLGHLEQTFKYYINVLVPANTQGYAKLEVVDTLESVLDYLSAEVRVAGVKNQTLSGNEYLKVKTVNINDVDRTEIKLALDNQYDYSTLAGKLVTLVIGARIKEGADLTSYINSGGIPNTATLNFNDKPGISSGEVTVTPPGEGPTVKKEVSSSELSSGGALLSLNSRGQDFYYRLIFEVPQNVQGYKSIVLEDVLEGALVPPTVSGVHLYSVQGASYASVKSYLADGAITVEGQNIRLRIAADTFAAGRSFNDLAGKTLMLSFKTNIREGANLSGYEAGKVPNKATLAFNGVPKTTGEVSVVPPGETPTPQLDVNGYPSATVTDKAQAFTYNVSYTVPTNLSHITCIDMLDTLESVLETSLDKISVTVDGVTYAGGQKSLAGNQVVFHLNSDELSALTGKTVVVSIVANIRADADLTGYANNTIPNSATVNLNEGTMGTPQTTDNVPVTLSGTVNIPYQKIWDGVELNAVTLYVVTAINESAAEVKTLADAVQVANLTKATGWSGAFSNLQKYDNAGAEINYYVKEVLPAGYTNEITTDESGNVTVKNIETPSGVPTPQIDVNGQESLALNSLTQTFTYHVKVTVPSGIKGFTEFVLSDDLEDVLTTSEEQVKVYVDGLLDNVLTGYVEVAGNLVTLDIPMDTLAAYKGKNIDLAIGASIRDDVTASELAAYVTLANPDGSIPNKATLTVGDEPAQTKESGYVWVTPPTGDAPGIEKKVNGKDRHVLGDLTDTFTYTVKTVIAGNTNGYKTVVIEDQLESILEATSVTVTIGGADVTGNITTYGTLTNVNGLITLTLNKSFASMAGKEVVLTVDVKVKDDATPEQLKPYLNAGSIPNTASLSFNNNPAVTDTVEVVPPSDAPTVDKQVNGSDKKKIDNLTDDLVYTIKVVIPENTKDITRILLTDTLVNILQIQGPATVEVKRGGTADANLTADASSKLTTVGQTVTLSIVGDEESNAYAGTTITITVTAKIDLSKDLASYLVSGAIPNTARLSINNDPTTDVTDTAEVVPPTELTPVKTINDGQALVLDSLTEEFTYKVTVDVGEVDGIATFVLEDSVDNFLVVTPGSVKVWIGDDEATVGTASIDETHNIVKYTLNSAADIATIANKAVTLEFKASLDSGLTYAEVADIHPSLAIPNTATIQINNNLPVESNKVTVTPVFGKVVLTKTSGGEALPDGLSAVFSLYKVNGTEEVFMKEYVTVNGKIEIVNLNSGQYYFVERFAPEGHILDTAKYRFTVNAAGKAIAGEGFENFTVDNLPLEKTSFTVTKKWVGGPADKPAVFVQLYRALGEHKEPVGMPVTLGNGTTTYTWNNLAKTTLLGEEFVYSANELIVPTGYEKTVSEDGKTITNTYVPSLIDLEVKKIWAGVDDPDNYTATFRLKANDELVAGRVITVTGNAVGRFEGLPGTDVDGNMIEYEVTEDAVTGFSSKLVGPGESCCDYLFVNTRNLSVGHFAFTVIDHVTNAPLSGATFELRKHESPHEVVATATSNSTGVVEFKNIQEGTYQLVETVYPTGYHAFDVIRTVVVGAGGAVTIGDEPVGEGYTIANIPVHTPLTLVKIDSKTKAILPGAVFNVYRFTGTKAGGRAATQAGDGGQPPFMTAGTEDRSEMDRLKRSLAIAEDRVRELEQAIADSERSAERLAELEAERIAAEEHLETLRNTLPLLLKQAGDAVAQAARALQDAATRLEMAEAELNAFRQANTDGQLDALVAEQEETVTRLTEEKVQAQRQYDDALAVKAAVEADNTAKIREATENLADILS